MLACTTPGTAAGTFSESLYFQPGVNLPEPSFPCYSYLYSTLPGVRVLRHHVPHAHRAHSSLPPSTEPGLVFYLSGTFWAQLCWCTFLLLVPSAGRTVTSPLPWMTRDNPSYPSRPSSSPHSAKKLPWLLPTCHALSQTPTNEGQSLCDFNTGKCLP